MLLHQAMTPFQCPAGTCPHILVIYHSQYSSAELESSHLLVITVTFRFFNQKNKCFNYFSLFQGTVTDSFVTTEN